MDESMRGRTVSSMINSVNWKNLNMTNAKNKEKLPIDLNWKNSNRIMGISKHLSIINLHIN
jgi:hypothetical protein